jgi:regulator of telomere elongation helicase 1
VNPKVNIHRGMSLNSMCKKVRDARKDSAHCCKFYRNTNDSVIPNGSKWDISDIEDMHKLGKQHVACPYYLQKIRVQFSDLILMPYNYLIDPKIRENFKINFENSIIIMDEAHNVERVAEEVASFELHVNSMYQIINELIELENDIKNQQTDRKFMSSAENVNEILIMTQNF